MLAFDDAESAKSGYLSNYDSDKYFGSIEEFTMDEFKKLVFDEKKGEKVSLKEYYHGVASNDYQNMIYSKYILKESKMAEQAKKQVHNYLLEKFLSSRRSEEHTSELQS